MSRKAIIIEASNVRGEQVLPGAIQDVKNWRDFLTSNLGGAWDSTDIISLSKPDISLVDELLTLHRDKYVLIAFSGHGFEHKSSSWQSQGIPKVLLNDKEKDIDIKKLHPKGTRGSLFVDACRAEVISESVSCDFSTRGVTAVSLENNYYLHLRKTADSLAMSSTSQIATDPGRYKAYWLQKLQESNHGIVTMQSCSINEEAAEDPDAGGLYTTLLIHNAKQWWQQTYSTPLCYSTKDVHEAAKNQIQKRRPQQTPEYSPSNVHFPFAVKI